MFAECGGSQCGFCTPGFLVVASALLEDNPTPTDQEIKSAIEGNLCRCTGYQQIVDSVKTTLISLHGLQIEDSTSPKSDPHPDSLRVIQCQRVKMRMKWLDTGNNQASYLLPNLDPAGKIGSRAQLTKE